MADDPYEWVKDLRRTVNDKLMRQIVDDFAGYNPSPRSPLSSPPATVQIQGAGRVVGGDDVPVASTGTGWADSPQLKPPPGVDLIDQMVAAQDERDLVQRAKELAVARQARALAEAAFKEPKKDKEPKE
jgi:hypothetical protein